MHYVRSLRSDQHRPELFFLTVSLFFGLSFALILPPMQGADEPNHLYRTYQVAHGGFIAEPTGGSIGGEVPIGLIILSQRGLEAAKSGNIDDKYTKADIETLWQIEHNDELLWASFSNTSVYSPLAYAPRAPAIWLSDLLNTRPVLTLYMARISGLLFSILIVMLALRLLPFGRLPFAVIGLLPMTLMQFSIISADTTLLALTFLSVALVLRFAYQKRPLTKLNIAALFMTFGAVCLTKPAMFPITILLLLLLANKTMKKTKVRLIIAGGILFSLLATLAWNIPIKDLSITAYQTDFQGTDYEQQLHFVTHEPLQYVRVIYETLFTTQASDLPAQFIGKFGWLDTALPSAFVILGFVLITLAVFIGVISEGVKLSYWARIVALVSGIGIILAGLTSQYLLSAPLRGQFVVGVQGRYFLPAALPFIVACYASKKHLSTSIYRKYSVRILLAMTVLLGVALLIIAIRFYDTPNLTK